MKITKRLFSFLLCAALLLSALPASAELVVEVYEYENLRYTVSYHQVVITGIARPAEGYVNIPDTINGDPVVGIGSYAFYRSDITGVYIPETVRGIGDSAFEHCTGLTSVTIPDSVTNIGSRAFAQCTALETLRLQGDLETMGEYAFYGCTKLKDLTLEWGIKDIGAHSFKQCDSIRIHVPSAVGPCAIAAT